MFQASLNPPTNEQANPQQQESSLEQSNPNRMSTSMSLVKAGTPEFKVPQVEFLSQHEPGVDFQVEIHKLLQANCVLSELVKDAVIDKYALSERIIIVSERIRSLENPTANNTTNSNPTANNPPSNYTSSNAVPSSSVPGISNSNGASLNIGVGINNNLIGGCIGL